MLILGTSISKTWLPLAALPSAIFLVGIAYFRPGYFTSQTYLGGVILLELLALALWKFRQAFFPLMMTAFLCAGADVPYASIWTSGRWVILGIGALAGTLIALKTREFTLRLVHLLGFFCAVAALVSAASSRYPNLAMLKALSLFLLILYASSGARLAAREARFIERLLLGCEIVAGVTTLCYLAGFEVWGNPNSLGAVIGVGVIPLLLWGMLVEKNTFTRRRRLALLVLCTYLLYYSHARAAILAAVISCGVLCVCAREYKMLAQALVVGGIVVAAGAIVQPQHVSEFMSGFTSDVVYKGAMEQGMLASRHSTWQNAMDAIGSHYWFGTGFGTADNATDSTVTTGYFSSNFNVTAEYGSSYLAMVVGLGVLGSLPFLLLLLLVAGKIVQTLRWVRATGNAFHPAVPLAVLVTAGLVHAAFEDWMFAVGYYLCVFFWTMAFALLDLAPAPASGYASREIHPLPTERRAFLRGCDAPFH